MYPHDDPSVSRPSYPPGSPAPANVREIRLRAPAARLEQDRLGWLPRRLGLELYSAALLTRKVRVELAVVAAALLFVFLFELAAWSFFLNGLFAGDMRRLHWAGTPAAIALALVFAGTILFFERQVVIADFPRWPLWKKAMAAVVRILAILGAGFIVAHAVDLLAFHDPIERKLHGDAVQTEARRLGADLDRLRTDLDPGAERADTTEKELERVHDEIDRAQTHLDQAVADEKRYQEELRSLRRHTTTASSFPSATPDELRRAAEQARELPELEGKRAAASATAAHSRTQLAALKEKKRALVEQKLALGGEAEHHRLVVSLLASRLDAWVAYLQREEPGPQQESWTTPPNVTVEDTLRWPDEWRQPLRFTEPAWSFFEKVDALYDVILNPSDDVEQGQAGGERTSRGASPRSPASYRVSFVGIHLAAMFVPLLVFFIKWFFMSKEVDAYFSAWHQAHAGDPDARLMLGVEEHVSQSLEAEQ